jgi:hypothetical protein
MAEIFGELPGGAGSYSITGAQSYERVFEVYYDDPIYDANIVARHPGLPAIGSLYAPWAPALLVEINPRQDTNRGNGNHWTITCRYSNQQQGLGQDPNDQDQDPEQRAPKITWSARQVQVFRERDIRGKKKCNSAGDPFIPQKPTFESIRVATVRYFVRQKPAGLLALHNCINSNEFTVDGEVVKQHCCRIADIQCSEFRIDRGVRGRDITIVFEIGDPKTLSGASDITGVGNLATVNTNLSVGYWIADSLDRGRREWDTDVNPAIVKEIIGPDKNQPMEPSLLDGSGGALLPPVPDGFEVYRIWYDYPAKNFSLIRLQ